MILDLFPLDQHLTKAEGFRCLGGLTDWDPDCRNVGAAPVYCGEHSSANRQSSEFTGLYILQSLPVFMKYRSRLKKKFWLHVTGMRFLCGVNGFRLKQGREVLVEMLLPLIEKSNLP